MDRHWRRLLEKRDSLEAVKVLQEVQTSASGILQRTSYLRPSPGRTQGSIGALAGSVWAVGGGVRQFSEAELEAVRQVWDRNSDQVGILVTHMAHPINSLDFFEFFYT